jgi:hypothetical protein
MSTRTRPLVGKPAPASVLIDAARLVAVCFWAWPDAAVAAQRAALGTSGHQDSAKAS